MSVYWKSQHIPSTYDLRLELITFWSEWYWKKRMHETLKDKQFSHTMLYLTSVVSSLNFMCSYLTSSDFLQVSSKSFTLTLASLAKKVSKQHIQCLGLDLCFWMPWAVKWHQISVEIGRPICWGHFRALRPCGYDKKRVWIIRMCSIIDPEHTMHVHTFIHCLSSVLYLSKLIVPIHESKLQIHFPCNSLPNM